MQNLITISHTVCTHVKGPKKFLAHWYPIPLEYSASLSTRNMHVFHLSYHGKISHCMGSQKFLGHWAPAPLG